MEMTEEMTSEISSVIDAALLFCNLAAEEAPHQGMHQETLPNQRPCPQLWHHQQIQPHHFLTGVGGLGKDRPFQNVYITNESGFRLHFNPVA